MVGDDWVSGAYANGVPMGGYLPRQPSTVDRGPYFIIQAKKDPEGANLDRVQIIKAYLDDNDNPQEQIFEVAWAGDRTKDSNGKLPSIGSTVDEAAATYTNDIGAISLQTIWEDPTLRWTTYDAVALGLAPLSEVPTSTQERAWSSPIWYTGG